MLDITIDNLDGRMWDISGLVSQARIKTSRIGKASSLELTFLRGGFYQDKTFDYAPGHVVRVSKDGQQAFYGYIFTIDSDSENEVKLTAYDQLRYLMASDTFVFRNASLAEIIKQIAGKMNLKTGSLADTGYKIPQLVEDKKKLMDMICDAQDRTLIATQRTYVLYDDFGQLALRSLADMRLPIMLGDASLVHGYSQSRSIDQDTYNQVKIVQDNKKTGRRDVYITKDSGNIAKWGLLQLYQVADEGLNAAQINEAMGNLMELKNREQRTFTVESIGDMRVRAGSVVTISIAAIGVNREYVVEECTHSFDGLEHSMTLELKVYDI